MQPLKLFIAHALQATWKIKLLTDWPHIIGNLSDRVSIEKIYDDTLILGVNNPCLLQELYLLSPVLLQTINDHIELPRIKTVRFKHATKKDSTPQAPSFNKITTSQKTYMLQKHEQKALEIIKDIDLKNALQAFLKRCHEGKK